MKRLTELINGIVMLKGLGRTSCKSICEQHNIASAIADTINQCYNCPIQNVLNTCHYQYDQLEAANNRAEEAESELQLYKNTFDNSAQAQCIFSIYREYEKAIADKTLISLPCRVGIDVYARIGNEIKTCCCIGWKWNGGNIYMLCMDRETGREYSFFDFHFTGSLAGHKTVFLTREEAEKAKG